MARIRTVKPEFFKHHDLYLAEIFTGLPLRLAFQGLWLCADKEGRFKWQPMPLKLDILPYDDIDFNQVLCELARYGWILQYDFEGKHYGVILSFKEHQRITGTESKAESRIPPPPEKKQIGNILESHKIALEALRKQQGRLEGKGKEGNGVSILPNKYLDSSTENIVGTELAVSTAKQVWEDQKWREQMCMAHYMKEDDLKRWMAQFNASVANDNFLNFDSIRYKKLFGGWLNTQKGKGYNLTEKGKTDAPVLKKL